MFLRHTMRVSSPSDSPPSPSASVEEPEADLHDVLDLIAAVVTVGLVAVVATGRAGLPRIVLALGFAFFVPGRAIVTNWPRLARWSEVAITMVLSLAVLTLVAMVSLWAHLWSPVTLFYSEAGLCLAGLAARQVWRKWLRKEPSAQEVKLRVPGANTDG